MDQVKRDSNAASTGERLYFRLGFEKVEGVDVENEDNSKTVYV